MAISYWSLRSKLEGGAIPIRVYRSEANIDPQANDGRGPVCMANKWKFDGHSKRPDRKASMMKRVEWALIRWMLNQNAKKGIPNKPGVRLFGLEYQVLDDKEHPDMLKREKTKPYTASLYRPDHFKKNARAEQSRMEYGTYAVVYPDNRVEHYLNGELMVSYVRGSKEYLDLVAWQ
ncbi:hypothetical protein FQR65_LT15196 [Abscondita terminalis]|nr:hypothetical protein FQR65_LT15196 [Abscondita terminalis]